MNLQTAQNQKIYCSHELHYRLWYFQKHVSLDATPLKVKVKVNVDLYSVITPLRRSGMARVLKGSHSFTCTPRVHPLTE